MTSALHCPILVWRNYYSWEKKMSQHLCQCYVSLSLSFSHSLALSEDFLVAKQMTPVKKSERKNCRKTKLATKYDFFTNKNFFIFLFPKFFLLISLSLSLSFSLSAILFLSSLSPSSFFLFYPFLSHLFSFTSLSIFWNIFLLSNSLALRFFSHLLVSSLYDL